jgi:hypothetical protein
MNASRSQTTAAWRLAPGERLPCWCVVAQNDATDSGNPMHDDERARQLGFAGGLVPGVTLYGYLTRPFVALFGQSFLECASLEVRFRQPVYAGEAVSTHVTVGAVREHDCSFEFEFELRNAAGAACVVGRACYPGPDRAAIARPCELPLPGSRRPATPEELRREPRLGTLQTRFTGAQSETFTAGLGYDLALYRTLVHPAWLLRQANLVVDRNLAVGPWIHVASEIQPCGVVRVDEPLSVHGTVAALSERKGHDYADIEVVYVTDRPVLRVLHKAIYRMGTSP